jgi:hypothetical protein
MLAVRLNDQCETETSGLYKLTCHDKQMNTSQLDNADKIRIADNDGIEDLK